MTSASDIASRGATSAPGKYLTFALGAEEFGVPVLKVREIIKMMDVTSVPRMPPYIRGVINLRGKVIPVVDLRLKFGMSIDHATDHTCIIVVEVSATGRRLMLGVIVDGVSDVLNITTDELEATPEFGERLETSYLHGIAKIKGTVKLLLDLDAVLAGTAAFV